MVLSAGERRIVTVLFADIVDSTAIGETLGPERSKFLFDEVTRLLAAEVKRFGGTVAQFTGDGLYALYGVPHAHEDDAERAVRAALAIQTTLAGYAQDVAEAYGIDLAARVGINTGPVVVLPDDAPLEERFNALGDTVNTAARLQAHAGRSGVAVGPDTARQVEASFELEPVGPVDLKGKAAPLAAFRVAAQRERIFRRLSPLVGRDEELAVLDEVFGDLVDGRGAIVAITGEPGIGKSRLVAEARGRWEDRVQCVGAQGVSYAQDVPYYPMRELLRGFLGLGIADPEARIRLELKAQLAAALGDGADAQYPFLATLLGLALEPDAEERIRVLARDSVQRQSHEAVLELARSLSRRQPLVLVLEDLHFADEPTLELFEELLSLADEEAVVLLLLYRSDPDLPSWTLGETARRRYRHRFRELQLDSLEQDAASRLAVSAAGGKLTPALSAQLAERTGGNPLFLEEAARDVVERGDGGTAVPAAIQETLQARLDRLTPDVREVASLASVVGRSFGLPLLERLVPRERLSPALSELQRLDLVVEERRRPTPEYRFRHGLVQEAAYTSLLEQRRRELHSVVGAALEELDRDELSEAYGLLAHHFAEADEPERAARYLLEAGDSARNVYADDEAFAHYRRALTFLDRLGDARRARSLLFKIALLHHTAFDFEAANAAWSEAFTRPQPPPVRLEPSEHLETAFIRVRDWVPGYGYDVIAWALGANLFRGLLRFAPGLDVVPDLAEHVSVSSDGCRYLFRLRQGLRWSDGQPLTAHDFAFTYTAMREEDVASAHLIAGIEARAQDAVTLELRLPDADAHMLYLLAQLACFPWPRHHVEAVGPGWHEPLAAVANGPFAVSDLAGERTVLMANPFWKGSRGNVETLTISHVDARDALDDWPDGRFDFLVLPGGVPVVAEDHPTIRVVPLLSVEYLAFPSHPPFEDVRVRLALAHALDRGLLAEGTGNVPAYGGLLPPAMPGHSHDAAPARDVARARALLAEAGYPDGRGLPELRLIHADAGVGADWRTNFNTRWDSQWRELGVRLVQDWVPFTDMATEIGKPHSFWEWGWASDYPDAHGMLGTFLRSELAPGAADVLGLVDQARSLRSRDERLDLLRRADRRLVTERAWVVPTVYDAWHLLQRSRIDGIWSHPLGLAPLENVVVHRPA